jgi:hypothetical protein
MRFYIKVGLAALFGCGVIAAVCATVKTKQLGTITATSDLTCKYTNLQTLKVKLIYSVDQLAPLDIWAVYSFPLCRSEVLSCPLTE